MARRTVEVVSVPAREMLLAELETHVVAVLVATGQDATFDSIHAVGSPTVQADNLRFYRPERWGHGEWISRQVMRRITSAVKTAAAEREAIAEAEAEAKRAERERKAAERKAKRAEAKREAEAN